jgi:MFS family permease
LGFGGEWAAGAVLIGEIASAEHRGKAVGSVQSAWSWGWGLAALAATLAFQILPPEIAWRVMFFIGILPAGLIFAVRRMVPEPEIFLRAQQNAGARRSVFSIFSRDLIYTTVFGSLLAVGAHGGYYAITTWLPTFLRTERQLSNIGSGGYLAVVILGSFVGYVTSAYLSDSLGRRRTFILFALGAMAMVVGYTQASVSNNIILLLGFPLGFLSSGIFSGCGPFYTELFPTSVRGTGQGFCYNFGRGCAAGVPALVGFISTDGSLGKAIYVVAGCAYAVLIVAALCLPETRGRELR